MATKDEDKRDGIDSDEPTKEVGPHGCAPGPGDCEFEAGERSGPVHESEYRPSDELDDAFSLESLATPIAPDGLPDHGADEYSGDVHPFTLETMCCIEDRSAYVELFAGELGARGMCRWDSKDGQETWAVNAAGSMPFIFKSTKLMVRERFAEDGSENDRAHFGPAIVKRMFGVLVASLNDSVGVPVRPVRERCVYYKRQHFGRDGTVRGEPGHNIIFRNCTHPARRSIGGAAMSLRDEAIYGCDYREPADPKSCAWMNEHDDTKIEKRPDLTRVPMFALAGDEVRLKESK